MYEHTQSATEYRVEHSSRRTVGGAALVAAVPVAVVAAVSFPVVAAAVAVAVVATVAVTVTVVRRRHAETTDEADPPAPAGPPTGGHAPADD